MLACAFACAFAFAFACALRGEVVAVLASVLLFGIGIAERLGGSGNEHASCAGCSYWKPARFKGLGSFPGAFILLEVAS